MISPNYLPRVDQESLSEKAYHILKEKILDKTLPAGQRLKMDEVKTQMGVSRTPLNEALSRLAMEGLVEIVPRKGTYVTILTPKDIEESFDVRRMLEVSGTLLAAQEMTPSTLQQLHDIAVELRRRLDTGSSTQAYRSYLELDHRFHRMIIQSTGNALLLQLWEHANVHVQTARIRYTSQDIRADFSVFQEGHEQILEALAGKDLPTLQQLVGDHIDQAKVLLLRDAGAPSSPHS